MNISYETFTSFSHFITYQIDNDTEKITVHMIDSSSGRDMSYTDTFDFSPFADGTLDTIETSLPINPIISAKRVDGALSVVLRKTVNGDNI